VDEVGQGRGGRLNANPEGRGRLFFASRRLTPGVNIGLRIGIAAMCLILTATIVYFERSCYRDGDEVGTLSLLDAFYYATVSLSTTGYGDITPICPSSRLVNILAITPLRFLFLIVLIGTTIEALTTSTREEFRSSRWRKHVQDHTIVIGFGVKGRSAAKTIHDAGTPANRIVVVASDRLAVEEATRNGYVGVVGDSRREEVLRDAAIDKASRIVIAVDEDDTSVLITLTARRLAPKATIVVSARESVNADILRQSGADAVIPTAESAGHLMGLSLISPVAGELMEDLLDSGRGLEVVERPITREELGRAPGALEARGEIVLAVIRSGEVHRFDQSAVTSLQQADRLVVIRHNTKQDQAIARDTNHTGA